MNSQSDNLQPQTDTPTPVNSEKKPNLGAFVGVFTPTILTILGVIMYLRFGWVVGQMGLYKTLLIVIIASSITLVTSFSLSAIATNSRVGVGGAYFMISRSLGLDFGGAIGLPLFLSQALSVTLYAFGLAESLRFVWPATPLLPTTFVIILAVAALAWRGADIALKAQLPIMVMIGLSLLALTGGALSHGNSANIANQLAPEYGFWVVFAVFFPAVTGIMAGLSLSGDLKDPKTAISRGTLGAILCGVVIYLIVPILLAYSGSPAELKADPMFWTKVSFLGPWLILPGLWGAIFSSAVGSMLGAPRTLQALARDHLAPTLFDKVDPDSGEPLWGIALTLGIALTAVFLGGLNSVAQVVTMFFLTVYGTTNLVATLEKVSRNPAWRPTIDIPWHLSLAGAFSCFAVMALINATASLVAITVEVAIWLYLKHKINRETWGDVWRDVYVALIRWALVKLVQRPMTARNWRPHLLVFVSDINKRLDLVRFGTWFTENRGIVTACELIVGDVLDVEIDTEARQEQIRLILQDADISAFSEVNVVHDIERGVIAVTQASGIAGIPNNTILLGMPDDLQRLTAFLKLIQRLEIINRSMIIGSLVPRLPGWEKSRKNIHIWWGGLQRNGDLMLLLAYLLSQNPEWHDTTIRVLSIASNKLMHDKTEKILNHLIPEIRIKAEIEIMIRDDEFSIKELMMLKSSEADIVFLGLATPEEGEEEEHAKRLLAMAEGLPTCFFVHNGSLFIGDLLSSENESQATKKI